MTSAEKAAVLRPKPFRPVSRGAVPEFCRCGEEAGFSCDTCGRAVCGRHRTKSGKRDACPRHAPVSR